MASPSKPTDPSLPADMQSGSQAPAGGSQELRRRLSQRQLTMLALGGAIGVGLFLGSGVTIQLAGPGVIVSYLLGAIIAMIVAYALVEMEIGRAHV